MIVKHPKGHQGGYVFPYLSMHGKIENKKIIATLLIWHKASNAQLKLQNQNTA